MQVFELLGQYSIHQKCSELMIVAQLQRDLCHKEGQSVCNVEGLAWLYTMIHCMLSDLQKHVEQCFSVLFGEPVGFLCFE